MIGGSSVGASNLSTKERELQIPAAVLGLRFAVEDLEGALAVLFNRLEPALAVSPAGGVDATKQSGYSCPLADTVLGQTIRIRAITSAAQTVVDRLEI